MAKDVLVIGGGISGLTAAYTLLKQPNQAFRVTVLEAEDVPGGQARAFTIDGDVVEHGSHAFFGYYTTVLGIIEELRADPELAAAMPGLLRVDGWTLVDPYGRRAFLTQSSWLPTMIAALPSIFRVPWFSFCDKVRAAWAALRLILTPFADFNKLDQYTSYDYGKMVGYSDIGIWTWNSASLGLTNMFVQEQSAAILAGKHKVLVGSPQGLSYQLPAGNLSLMFAEPMRKKIQKLGGEVLTSSRALAVSRPEGQARTRVQVKTPSGTVEREADYVICALQPWDAKEILPWVNALWGTLERVSPVYTVVLQLSGKVTSSSDGRELGTSREFWTFSVVTDLSRFWPEYKGDKSVLRVEIGHADLLPGGLDLADEFLLDLIKHDLDRLFPEIQGMKIEWSRVHRETKQLYVRWVKGTFAKKPTPEQRDVGQGVFLCGDWTTKGTIGMEAAANSGVEAANHVLAGEKLAAVKYTDVPLY
jgi:protoporphyrinogen oxidase